jgi:hypothetical protein
MEMHWTITPKKKSKFGLSRRWMDEWMDEWMDGWFFLNIFFS